MEILQSILAYTILALAIGYLVYKFLWPKSLFAPKRAKGNTCGQDKCGCH